MRPTVTASSDSSSPLEHPKLSRLRPLHRPEYYTDLRQKGHTRTADYEQQIVRKAPSDTVLPNVRVRQFGAVGHVIHGLRRVSPG